jgi:drug/metabolite transporter (DMT)-like permease
VATAVVMAPGPMDLRVVWPWVLVALAAHTAWGMNPVLGRYLQTVSELPSLSLLVVGYAPLAVIFLVHTLPRHGRTISRSRGLWLFALIVVARSITNVLAARFTLAIYVQLITLMTPFIVAFLSVLVLREPLPRHIWPALLLSSLGSLLMISSDIGAGGVAFALTRSDWLGIGLALASSLFLALYMIVAGRTARTDLSGWSVLFFQSIVILTVSLAISLLVGEEWGRWRQIGAVDWSVMAVYALVVMVAANGMQLAALRHLGAPVVSSLMGWRLLSTLVVAMLLLGEGLQSGWQVVGMVIVLATLTWYLTRRPEP